MSRKSVYKEKIEPNIEAILTALTEGSTEKAVYESLKISKSAWFAAKKSNKDFSNLIACAHAQAEIKIDNAIYTAACGYYKEEIKTVKSFDKNGNPFTETITTKKWHEPNVTALAIWKRNHNSEYIDKDQSSVDNKKQELNLKKEVAKDKAFGSLNLGDENEHRISGKKSNY